MVLGVPLLDDSTDNKFLWACAGPQKISRCLTHKVIIAWPAFKKTRIINPSSTFAA